MMVRIQNQQCPILAFFAAHPDRDIKASEIVERFSDGTARDRARVYGRLGWYAKSGVLSRPGRGLWRYRSTVPVQPGYGQTKAEAMWRILRARRSVSVDDLQELTGASYTYAGAWLRTMVRHGAVRKAPGGKYVLVQETPAMPRDEALAARKREARARAKQKIKQIRKLLDEVNSEIEKT